MAALAAFAQSDKARLLVAAGVDLTEGMEDDVLAANLKAALLVATTTEDEPEVRAFPDGHIEAKGLNPFG